MDKKAKQSYKERFAIVRVEINRVDPMGLIEGGAPLDEYDPEVNEILAAIDIVRERKALSAEINGIFRRMFDEPFDENFFDKTAENLLETLEKA